MATDGSNRGFRVGRMHVLGGSLFSILILLGGIVRVANIFIGSHHTSSSSGATVIEQHDKLHQQPGKFRQPYGVALDAEGDVYVTDSFNRRLQKYSPKGRLRAVYTGPLVLGDLPAVGKLGALFRPYGIATDRRGNIYVTDTLIDTVVKLSPGLQPVAQWGSPDKAGSQPGRFRTPEGIAVDRSGNIYVVDSGNDRVQKLSATGRVLGIWGRTGTASGLFRRPDGIAVDRAGNVYVADAGNNRIQKFSASGKLLGILGRNGSHKGEFHAPHGVALDGAGYIYVTDSGNYRVQELSPAGKPVYIWDFNNAGELGDTPLDVYGPYGLAVDRRGRVFVADKGDDIVQILAPEGEQVGQIG